MYSWNRSRVFFGAKTDNDECLIDRVKLRFKTDGIRTFSKHCSGKKTKVGIVWNMTRICSEQGITQIVYSGNNPNKL